MELSNSEVCSICLENLIENIKITKCSGQKCKFHNNCYIKYINECNKNFRNKSCPLCREILEKRNVNYLEENLTVGYELNRSEELSMEDSEERFIQLIRRISQSVGDESYNSPIQIERNNICPPLRRSRRRLNTDSLN